MRRSWLLPAILTFGCGAITADAGDRPADIVDASTIVPNLELDMRYVGSDNFVGRPIAGYRAPKCYLTKRAAEALKGVQEDLAKKGLGLKVYDCYRPRSAVKDFVEWGRDLGDKKMKARFYPNVRKSTLFQSGYISSRSGHSRASTVDLTDRAAVGAEAAALRPFRAAHVLRRPQGDPRARQQPRHGHRL